MFANKLQHKTWRWSPRTSKSRPLKYVNLTNVCFSGYVSMYFPGNMFSDSWYLKIQKYHFGLFLSTCISRWVSHARGRVRAFLYLWMWFWFLTASDLMLQFSHSDEPIRFCSSLEPCKELDLRAPAFRVSSHSQTRWQSPSKYVSGGYCCKVSA